MHHRDSDRSVVAGRVPVAGEARAAVHRPGRGHEHDAEALRSCITSQAAYIGMIGSSHKVGVIKKRFLDEGWATPEQWSRVHTPIGLPIGSKTVQEIAISIAAQLIVARNNL